MTEYAWRDGFHTGDVDVEKAGRVLEKINRRDGMVTPDAVVREAKKKNSPIHGWFEWDDTEAARQYRLDQARTLIRAVQVTIVGTTGEHAVRAFVQPLSPGDGYEDVHTVLSVADKRTALLQRALRDLEAFQRKYAVLDELADVFAAAETAKRKAA